jgi:hypothetical protein
MAGFLLSTLLIFSLSTQHFFYFFYFFSTALLSKFAKAGEGVLPKVA